MMQCAGSKRGWPPLYHRAAWTPDEAARRRRAITEHSRWSPGTAARLVRRLCSSFTTRQRSAPVGIALDLGPIKALH